MVILGLGSCLGDREKSLERAIAELREFLRDVRVSPIYESPALLPPGAPAAWNRSYLNCAVAGETALEPSEMLSRVKAIEARLGRVARERWAPREIDIDILAWDERVVRESDLVVPHPGLLERPFALRPLADVAPTWRYPAPGPRQGQTARELAALWETTPHSSPELVGIVNVTPDSFSDGGLSFDAQAAAENAVALVRAGAAVLDIGAESTRPGARELTSDEEWSRLAASLPAIQSRLDAEGLAPRLSIDTRHARTARRVLERGIHWINDVSGCADPEMRRVLADFQCDVVVMHSLSVPARRDLVLPPGDAVTAVLDWANRRFDELERDGASRARLIFDPGVGFGKTAEQSLALLSGIERFKDLGTRILVGHSRKSFLSLFTQKAFADRDFETVTASLKLAQRGVQFLRVHNVDAHAHAFRIEKALR